MEVFVFGNEDVAMDALPILLVPELQKRFPDIDFIQLDPNEDWDVPDHMIIIDTVVGIEKCTVFNDLSTFMAAPRITCHDFDAYANLVLLKKVGQVKGVTIFGVPATCTKEDARTWLIEMLDTLVTKNPRGEKEF